MKEWSKMASGLQICHQFSPLVIPDRLAETHRG